MIKRLINWFKDYKYGNLVYRIEDNYVIITGVKDSSARSIYIPKTINGYTVLRIDKYMTRFGCVDYINGEKIKNSFHIINNRFIYKDKRIYLVEYNIGDDYYISYYLNTYNELRYSYIIGGIYNIEYYTNFIYIRS